MLFIDVNYDEYKPETYAGVILNQVLPLSKNIKTIVTVNTGNFEFDLEQLEAFVAGSIYKDLPVTHSSSIDNYKMDLKSCRENADLVSAADAISVVAIGDKLLSITEEDSQDDDSFTSYVESVSLIETNDHYGVFLDMVTGLNVQFPEKLEVFDNYAEAEDFAKSRAHRYGVKLIIDVKNFYPLKVSKMPDEDGYTVTYKV